MTYRTFLRAFFGLVVLCGTITGVMPSESKAGVILDIAGSQLLGARNIDIGGSLFDVAFVEGSCMAIYGGCDESTDFTFASEVSANVAARALLLQVFLDTPEGLFDTEPELTFGCSSTSACEVLIPFEARTPTVYRNVRLLNRMGGLSNGFSPLFANPSFDTTDQIDEVFAVFTPSTSVPEPSTLILFGMGMSGLALMRALRQSAARQHSS